jgi:hypothetical protein
VCLRLRVSTEVLNQELQSSGIIIDSQCVFIVSILAWVTHFYFEDEPLIFDESYERKEAYYALRDALFSITQGGTIGSSVMLDSDEDDDGNRWGHEWMPPSLEDEFANAATGDDRPDWEL